MQRISRKVQSLILALVMCLGIAYAGSVSSGSAPADAAADYYAPITAAGGEELLGQVHDLITTTHTKYTSYTDCKNPAYYRRTDPGPNGELAEFYAQTELSSTWKSGANGTWNREHVWCQSHSNGLWGESGGGADLLHIRPTESRVNSARGNNKYAVISGSKNTVIYRNAAGQDMGPAGYTGGGLFEPLDQVKGDVARIVLYMYTHYNTYSNVHGSTNGNGRSNYFGTLHFTDIVSASNEKGATELLLDWNELDPPDSLELSRNEAAQEIQGNRNPFVDHPEYAEAIWGDGTTEVKPTALTLSPSSLELKVGQSQSLTVSAQPAGASAAVTWSVSDSSVLSVSNGVVKALGEGRATVTAMSVSDPSVKAVAEVTVERPVDQAKLEAFHAAVEDIDGEGTLARRAASLRKALSAYSALTDKELPLAEEDIGRLSAALDDYNRLVRAYNEGANDACDAALRGIGKLIG